MMVATLQAPLAALTAMLELTANPHIILPGMLALITAGLISRELFGKESVYLVLLKVRGHDYDDTPLTQALRRIGVASVMERRFETLPLSAGRESIVTALAGEPRWIVILEGRTPLALMPAADLANHLAEHPDTATFRLTDIPARRLEIKAIDFQATLDEAYGVLNASSKEALFVTRRTIPGIERIYGVLTRQDIEHSYSVPTP